VAVDHRQGDFTLEATFESHARVVALFGPSGSGKTTLLHVIAGLTRPKAARIEVSGTVLTDTTGGVFVPPHKRRVGYVFQDGRLFPHMNVRQNLLYGRRFARNSERFGSLEEIASLLGIEALLHRRPGTLSGGEKQRVAIGRALLASPRLLLMDEPLSSLDAKRKAETLPYIERLRDTLAIPIIYVSHDLDEITHLTRDVVRLDSGRIAGLSGSLKPIS